MRKLLMVIVIVFFSSNILAQEVLNTVFNKSMEHVNTKNNKECYKGQLSNKTPNGIGLCKWNDGILFIGDFSNGKINGQGIQLALNGQEISNCDNCVMFVGCWKNGLKSGKGTCYDKNGDLIYFGNFENNKPIESYPSNEDFSQYHFLSIKYNNGNYYFGESNNDVLDGSGVFVWENGDLWFGNFTDGKRVGVGIYLLYNGEWVTLNCKGDDCTQITSSLDYKELEMNNKETRAQVVQRFVGFLTDELESATTGLYLIQSMKDAINNSTNSNLNNGMEKTSQSKISSGTESLSTFNCERYQSAYSEFTNTIRAYKNDWNKDVEHDIKYNTYTQTSVTQIGLREIINHIDDLKKKVSGRNCSIQYNSDLESWARSTVNFRPTW